MSNCEKKQIKNRVRKISTPINKKEIYTQTPSHSIDLTSKKDKKTKDKEKSTSKDKSTPKI